MYAEKHINIHQIRFIVAITLEKPRDFDPFGQTGLPPLATI